MVKEAEKATDKGKGKAVDTPGKDKAATENDSNKKDRKDEVTEGGSTTT